MQRNFVFVDDEPMMINAIKRLVANESFDFYGFQSPMEALGQIDTIAPQVIISDQRMQGMSGIQFLEKVRQKQPNTIRMILTGHCMPADAESSLEKGDVFKFMAKPWDNDTLIQEIRNAFDYANSTKSPGMERCHVCGKENTADTMQVHLSLHLCMPCKKKVEPLPDKVILNIARFFDGNVI